MPFFPVRVIGNALKRFIKPTEEGHVIIEQASYPPLEDQKSVILSQKFTTDGTSTGTNGLGVDGSATSVDYYIQASGERDRYIARISFIMGYGASSELYEFADTGNALTNGVRVWYQDTNFNVVEIMNPKANYGFQRISDVAIGHNTWESRGFAATGDYGFFSNISLIALMPPYGLKLDRGTNQRMTITIRDDCRAADLFNCHAYGIERFE